MQGPVHQRLLGPVPQCFVVLQPGLVENGQDEEVDHFVFIKMVDENGWVRSKRKHCRLPIHEKYERASRKKSDIETRILVYVLKEAS